MDPFVGEIRAFGFNYAPRGWAVCNGQLLPIRQNIALFSVIGVAYGGDGTTTFALPNLQGQVAIGQDQGPGLSPRRLGQTGGDYTVTLDRNQLAGHTHTLNARAAASQGPDPANAVVGNGSWAQGQKFGIVQQFATNRTPNTTMAQGELQSAGNGAGHANLMPFQVQTYCIALVGIFPPRP